MTRTLLLRPLEGLTLIFSLCLFCCDAYTANRNMTSHRTAHQKWPWKSVATFASHILTLFLSPSGNIIKDCLESGKDIGTKFTYTAFLSVAKHEIRLAAAAACGLIIALFCFGAPCIIISLYRRKQNSITNKEANENPKIKYFGARGCVIYAFLVVFISLSIFGGVLLTVGILQSRRSISLGFNTAATIINVSYYYKITVEKIMNTNMNRVVHASNAAIRNMQDIDPEVFAIFMNKTHSHLEQANYREMISSQKTIQHQIENLNITLKNTSDEAMKLIKEYQEAVENISEKIDTNRRLKRAFGQRVKELTKVRILVLNPLPFRAMLEELSNLTLDGYWNPGAQIERFLNKLSSERDELIFSPTPVVAILRRVLFNMKSYLKKKIFGFFDSLKSKFSSNELDLLNNSIRRSEKTANNLYAYIYPIFVTIGILGCILSIAILIFLVLAVIGHGGCKRISKNNAKLQFFDFTVWLLLITSCFLWLFWLISVLLLLVSAAAYELCLTTEDLSVIDFALRNQTFQNVEGLSHPTWYTVFHLENSSIKQTFENCEKDPAGFRLFSISSLINSTFEGVEEKIASIPFPISPTLKKFPVLNLSSVEHFSNTIHQVDEMTKNISLGPFYSNISSLIFDVQSQNPDNVFDSLNNSSNVPNDIIILVDQAKSGFERLINFSVRAKNEQNTYDLRLRKLRESVEIADKLFHNASKPLKNLQLNVTKLYLDAVKSALEKHVTGLKHNVYSILQRSETDSSCCPYLNYLYDKTIYFTCDYLSPRVLVSWLGAMLLSLFILCSVILATTVVLAFPRQRPEAPTSAADSNPTTPDASSRGSNYSSDVSSKAGSRSKHSDSHSDVSSGHSEVASVTK